MTSLSPQAQAVLDAFLGDCENTGLQMDDMRENVAAALRALDEQLGYDVLGVRAVNSSKIRLIAAELDGAE